MHLGGECQLSEGNESNGRTHEPSLREVTKELNGAKELLLSRIDALTQLLDERDRLYSERDDNRKTAVDAALAAAKEAVQAALLAAKEAVSKAEDATKLRFESFNEFNTRIDTLTRSFPTREVVDTMFSALTTRLAAVELRQAQQVGAEDKGQSTKTSTIAIAAIISSAFFGAAAIVVTLILG